MKEHLTRKNQRFESTTWKATIQAASSVGAVISSGTSSEKPLQFTLPQNDNTYYTRHLHPVKHELFDSFINNTEEPTNISEQSQKSASFTDPLFTPDLVTVKYLRKPSKESTSGTKRKIIASNNMENDVACSKIADHRAHQTPVEN